MLTRFTFNILKKSMRNNGLMSRYIRNSVQPNYLICDSILKKHNLQKHCNLYVPKRFKSSKKKITDDKKHIYPDDEDHDEEETPVGAKILTINVQSLRLDAISKNGFGLSRNKIEEAFYESKIRVNSKKVFKKSMQLNEGDEVDLILHCDQDNSPFLVVNRIVILSIKPATNDSVQIKLSRDKNLLIEDYDEP